MKRYSTKLYITIENNNLTLFLKMTQYDKIFYWKSLPYKKSFFKPGLLVLIRGLIK